MDTNVERLRNRNLILSLIGAKSVRNVSINAETAELICSAVSGRPGRLVQRLHVTCVRRRRHVHHHRHAIRRQHVHRHRCYAVH